MQRCPQCQEPLNPAVGGRRLSCGLCGWVERPASDDEPLAVKAQEIASQQKLDTEPVWRYTIIGLSLFALLLVGFNTLFNAHRKPRVEASASTSPEDSGPATPLPTATLPFTTDDASPAPPSPTATPPISAGAPGAAGALGASPGGSPDPSVSASASVSGSPPDANTLSPSPGSASPDASGSPALPDGTPSQLPSGVLITPPPGPSGQPSLPGPSPS